MGISRSKFRLGSGRASDEPPVLNRQHIQRGLEFTASMLIARAPRHLNTFFVERTRLFHLAQLLQHLASVEIRGRVIGIVFQQLAELGNRAL